MTATASGNKHFDQLTEAGNPVGEVAGVDSFLIRVKGLQPCNMYSLVMFEDGSKGFVYQIKDDYVLVLYLGSEPLDIGTVAVIQHQELVCKVGKSFVGRVVSVTGDPLDGKGPIAADAIWPVFKPAPSLHERKLLDTIVESGILSVDSLFPLARGQRMALLGDSKTGKSALAAQLTINQKTTDQTVVYCLIAKRKSDVDALITKLEETGAMETAIVVVSTVFESLAMSYLAPYVACAMAEYLWQEAGVDTIIIYDDLTSHAHTYREVALLAGVSPGRDSYPGDMFYAHSSLLERAGRLEKTGKHLTSIALVNVAGGDITAYLPTNIMSITDGQWILDMETFRNGIRPAINLGLSVTRVGGAAHSPRQKALAVQALKTLADYRQAQEFARFGSELAIQTRQSLETGKRIMEMLTQSPTQVYSMLAQELMLDVVLSSQDPAHLDVASLRLNVNDFAAKVQKDEDFDAVKAELLAKCSPAAPPAPASAAAPAAAQAPEAKK
jgi:F-type H+-transporting ATPase subunit alpha